MEMHRKSATTIFPCNLQNQEKKILTNRTGIHSENNAKPTLSILYAMLLYCTICILAIESIFSYMS